MLCDCPECGRPRVSSWAQACPQCGFPVRAHLSGELESDVPRAAAPEGPRTIVGEVDCPRCDARGFQTFVHEVDGSTQESFQWCAACQHSGRLLLGESDRGFYAVAFAGREAFEAGDSPSDEVSFLGEEKPESFRYPTPGKRVAPKKG